MGFHKIFFDRKLMAIKPPSSKILDYVVINLLTIYLYRDLTSRKFLRDIFYTE